MAEKRIPFPGNRTDIPLSPRRPPGGDGQARERNRPEAPVARSSPGRTGVLVLPPLPPEETSNSSDSASSTEISMLSNGRQEFSGSAGAHSADDGKKLSFIEMVRERIPDQGMPQPTMLPTEETKLGFYEFLKQEVLPQKFSPSPGAKNKSKGKGSREKEKTSPAFGAASGRVRLRRAATESGRPRGDGKASAPPVPSVRRQDSGSVAQCFPGGFFTYRQAYQSDAPPQPTSSSRPDAPPQPTSSSRPDAEKVLQDDGKARIAILIGAERKALAQGEKGQGGEMTQGHVRAFFRTDKPVVWQGQTLNAFQLMTDFLRPRLEGCEIGLVLRKSKAQVLKDEVLKEFAQAHLEDSTNSVLIATQANGKPTGNYGVFKPYIDPILKSILPKDKSPATSCLPAEVRNFLFDMDAEVVKWCLENKTLNIRDINKARMNAILSILFLRGVVPLIKIASVPEGSWERALLTTFSTCLNSKFNYECKGFLSSIIIEATAELPGDLCRQLARRRAATVAEPTRFRDRGEQTGDRAPETGRRPIPAGVLRATCGSMQMREAGVAAIRAKKQALKAFELSLQSHKLAQPFLGQVKELLESLPASDTTRQRLCQAVLDYIPTYIEQIKANPAALDAAALASEVGPLRKLQAALQEEVAPAEAVQLSTAVAPALEEEVDLSETARSLSAELDALDPISSRILVGEDSQAESDDREAPLPAPEEKEKEKN